VVVAVAVPARQASIVERALFAASFAASEVENVVA
jgi:hypothetical protein